MTTKNNKLNTDNLKKIFNKDFNKTIEMVESNNKKIEYIDIEKIKPSKLQPRKYIDFTYIKTLANSIANNGLLQPIILKKHNNFYEIIAGERRFKACSLLKYKSIPSILMNLNHLQMTETSIIENTQRVNLSIIEQGIAFRNMIALYNLNHNEIAQKVGKSRSFVTNSLRFTHLPTKLQELLINKKITMGQLRPLISLNNHHPEEVLPLAQKIINNNINSRNVEMIVNKRLNKKFNSNKLKITKNKIEIINPTEDIIKKIKKIFNN